MCAESSINKNKPQRRVSCPALLGWMQGFALPSDELLDQVEDDAPLVVAFVDDDAERGEESIAGSEVDMPSGPPAKQR